VRRIPLGRHVRYLAEVSGVLVVYGFFWAMPIDWASAVGGFLGRTIGPWLPMTKRARFNIRLAMPELDDAAVERIVVEMWDNLGRLGGEVPHAPHLDPRDGSGRVEIVGMEHVEGIRKAGAAIVISAHLANWEVMAVAAHRYGLGLEVIYRAANNPYMEKFIQSTRHGEMLAKGARGARTAIDVLKRGRPLAMLADQKLNDGIPVPFFGRTAMTATSLVDFARKYQAPVFPAKIERLKGARFRITLLPPMYFEAGPDRHADLAAGMTRVNAMIETWVRDRPGQWLWLHRRWPESPI